MFLDPFTFTPPRPDVLTRAVESYQRVAAARFCRYARDAMNPDLLPRRLSGLSLEPSPKQLHAEVRALRHLTAIQRTLREIGGPAFDPDSPIPPNERFRLVDRRLNEIEEALGDDDLGAEPARHSLGEGGSACSASYPVDLESDDPLASADGIGGNRCPSVDRNSFYQPPEIEDLLEAVDFAQHVFAARAELLDKRRLTLTPEDFLLEIRSLRDLTAVIRTLRRMSAQPLPERQTHEDFQKEFAPETPSASSLGAEPVRRSLGVGGSACGTSAISSAEASAKEEAEGDGGPASSASHPESEVQRSSMPAPAPVSDISNFKSEMPDPSPSYPTGRSRAPSESEESVKSVDHSSSGLVNPVHADLRTRPVPRVPEVRTITSRRNGATPSSRPAPDRSAASRSDETNVPTDEPYSSYPSHQSHHFPHESRTSQGSHPLPVLHDKDPP